MKAAELIGQTFTYLTVIERAGSQNNHALWKCVCKCGKEVIASTGDLRQGKTRSCGCKKKECSVERTKDETGNKYGKLTVLYRNGTTTDGKAIWRCICECGNETNVAGKALRSGRTRSCGCLIPELLSLRSLHDLTGQRFGMLTVIERAPTKFSAKGNMSTCWKCICDCGRETIVHANALTTNGHTRSCGCMKSSFREEQISKVLDSLHIKYVREYTFEELLSPVGNKLRFDFALFDDCNNLLALIEHQGEQHYSPANNDFGKMQREISDQLKRDFCSSHDILLFEIRFDDDIMLKLKEILSQIKISHANPVPSSE